MNRNTILIAEDDKAVAHYYSAVFEGRYNVIMTHSGRHAVRHAKLSDEIHLAIIDYRMPDMTGLDVLREIKKCRPSMPVILVTGYGDENVAIKALRYGAQDYIKKPVEYEDLSKRVELLLSLNHAGISDRNSIDAEDNHFASIPLKEIALSPHFNKPSELSADPWVSAAQNCKMTLNSFLHSKIEKALRFIDQNYTEKISLESAAGKACMSRYHFSRAFKKVTGITYQEYVTILRVEKAKKILQNPGASITEIAHSLGYEDMNNLNRNFKKHTGLTPSAFRKLLSCQTLA